MATRNFLFQTVKVKQPKRNKFNLSFNNKLTTDFGILTPVMCKPVCPGDAWRVNANIFMRLMPMVNPVMHNCNVYIHFFFVPYHLMWNKWEEFITGGPDGTSKPDFPVIDIDSIEPAPGELGDYLGFPRVNNDSGSIEYVSAFPFIAYNLIWSEYYRDQNLEDAFDIEKYRTFDGGLIEDTVTEGVNDHFLSNLIDLHYRAWEKDYFTSALPFAQRGPAIGLGSGDAEVKLRTTGLSSCPQKLKLANGTAIGAGLNLDTPENPQMVGEGQLGSGHGEEGTLQTLDVDGEVSQSKVYLDPNGSLVVNGTLFDINQLRNSIRLQEWLEKNARGGGRYTEQLLSHFGVIADDQRLGRPEYLGGGVQPIVMSEVTQMAPADGSVLGEWAGNGFSYGSANGWSHYFRSHGIVMAILSVIPRSGYHQGIPREWSKTDKLDFMWPEFANLGEQPIYEKEIFYDGSQEADEAKEETFGYTPRYAEYKFSFDEVHGEMKDTMLNWHLNRTFLRYPSLNKYFTQVTPDQTKRIFAYQNGVNLLQ